MQKILSIPKSIWNVIDKNPELKKIVANMNWLFLDKIIQMAVAFFVGIWVIRYLGPEQYGSLSYAMAFVALFGVIAKLGMDNIAIREFIKRPKEKDEIFGTLLLLKFFSGIITFIVSLTTVFFIKSGDFMIFWLTFIIALGFIFQISDVFDFWFQSRVQSKYAVYVRSGVNILSGLIKIILILVGASLAAFAWVLLFGSIATLFGMVVALFFSDKKIPKFKINPSIGKNILRDSWPLILSGIAVTIYMRIDQVMIGSMLNNQLLGSYSAAVALSEAWYLVPITIVGSVFPAIIYAKKISKSLYLRRLQLLYDFMLWGSVIVAIPVSFFSNDIIFILFGQEYVQAGPVLAIYIWAGVAVSLNFTSGKFLIVENLTEVAFYRAFAGAVINIILNLFLIPIYGIVGSALATLISYSVSTLAILCFKDSKINAKMFAYALNPFKFFKRSYYIEAFVIKK